jgi:hypothetical protein
MDILNMLGGLLIPETMKALSGEQQAPAGWQKFGQAFIAKKDPIYDIGLPEIDPKGPQAAEQQKMGALMDWLSGKSKSQADAENVRRAEQMKLGSLFGNTLRPGGF